MICLPSELQHDVCVVCERSLYRNGKLIVRECRPKGPGDYLHDEIRKWVGEVPTKKCRCRDRIAKMNAWGVIGCREHLDEIVGWLHKEATKRGWWKCVVAVPGSLYFIKRMVLGSIKRAEIAATLSRDL